MAGTGTQWIEGKVQETTQGVGLTQDSHDAVAQDLQRLRLEAGDVPYAEIVRRIAHYRELNGASALTSRPARTTVYDVFRLGRSRVNPGLVGEIVRALGVAESEVAAWESRCVQVRRQLELAQEPAKVPERAPEQEPVAEPAATEVAPPIRSAGWRANGLLMVACVAINILGFSIVPWLGLPLYLDMIGTAIAALTLGPWYGVIVGVTTNAIGLSITDSSSMAFALVNVAGALVWGYGVRRLRNSQSISSFVLLNTLVAVVCTIVASAILVTLFHGSTGHGSESTTETLVVMGQPLTLAVFFSNLIHSLADKLLAGFVVLAVLGHIKRWFDVPFHATLVKKPGNGLQRSSTFGTPRT